MAARSSLSPCSSTSSNELDYCRNEFTIVEETEEGSVKIRVDYNSFFELPDTKPTTQAQCLARCKLCRRPYKFTLTTKGNLLKHLQNAHPKHLHDHKEERAKQLCKPKVPKDQCTFNLDGTMTVAIKPKEPFKNQDKVLTSIVKHICGRGGLPISTVEQDWFRSFIKVVEPRFENVSRVAVTSKLDELYEEEKQQLLAQISCCDVKPSVTVDFWTGCNGKSFMGSTVHYIHLKVLKSHAFFFVEVGPPHTSENVKDHFEDQLDKYSLKCFRTVTDNAANMKHAFELIADASELTESNEDEPENIWKPIQLKVEGWLGCSAHQLQLVVNDGYKELRGYHRIQNILTKAKGIATLSHKSSHFAYSLTHRIPVPCETRWNSYFRLYEHIVKHHDNITEALNSNDRQELIISRPQIELLNLVVNIMDYFSEATNILQQENNATSNRLIPVIDSLENAMLQTNRDNPAINAFCERLLTSLRERFDYLLTSELYQASTVLDPRIKLSFTDSDNPNDKKHFLFSSSVVKQSVLSLLPHRPQPIHLSSTTAMVPLNTSSEPATKKRRLLDFCSISDDTRLAKTIDAEAELQTYLDQPRLDIKPITFWSERKKTQLSTLALQLMSVPCSSAPVE